MFSFKFGAARTGAIAALLGLGGPVVAQNPVQIPSAPMEIPAAPGLTLPAAVGGAGGLTAPPKSLPAVPGAPGVAPPATGTPGAPDVAPGTPGTPGAVSVGPRPGCVSCDSCFDWKKVPQVRPSSRRLLPVSANGAGILLRARPIPGKLPGRAAEVPVPANVDYLPWVLRRR